MSESPMNYRQTRASAGLGEPRREGEAMAYLVLPAARRQREELMEKTFVLRSPDGHMTSEDAVQSLAVSEGRTGEG